MWHSSEGIWLFGCRDARMKQRCIWGAAWLLLHAAASSPFHRQGPVGTMDIQVPCGLCLTALKSAGEGCLVIISFVIVFVQSHVQICNPTDCRMPGFSVLHHLPEFAQTPVQSVMLSNHRPLSSPSALVLNLSQH